MEEIIHAFGIDARLIVIQVINFAVLAGLLWYFLYKPVLSVIDARREKVAQGVADAEAAARERAAAGAEKAATLTAAHAEAERVLERATNEAKDVRATGIADARAEEGRILAAAEARAVELAERTRRESEAEIAKLAVLAAEKVLRGDATSAEKGNARAS